MTCPFADRGAELSALNRAYRGRPCLVIVYGRRRIGKTRLLFEWLKRLNEPHVYYVAHLTSHEHNLRLMASKASQQLGDPLIERLRPQTIADLLDLIERVGAKVVVIDEFTYWVRASPRVLSELQEYIDTRLPSTDLLVVLSGSLVGVMEREIAGGGSPLYARSCLRIRLGELEYNYLRHLVPGMTSDDRVRLYALVGGIPFYLCLARKMKNVREVVEELITSPGAPLRDEKDLLLREELRDPHTYNAVLSAIARGYTTPAKIAEVAGLDPSHTHKYLHVLEHLGVVERRVPLFKKKGSYRIRDPVVRTWFTLVEPVLELLELGQTSEAAKTILEKIDVYTAPVWEDIVRAYLLKTHANKGYTIAGYLEHKGVELDIAILNPEEKKAIVAEAKWAKLSRKEAERLRREAERKAYQLLPKGYIVEETYVAAMDTEKPEDYWIVTPAKIEREG